MEKKRGKIIGTILISLLIVSLILLLIFGLYYNDKTARLIVNNSITLALEHFYDDFFTPLVCILISFFNAAYAIICLETMYKEKMSSPKRLICYWIYLAASLGAIVLHWLGFSTVFGILTAG